jgi:hypothetical protein
MGPSPGLRYGYWIQNRNQRLVLRYWTKDTSNCVEEVSTLFCEESAIFSCCMFFFHSYVELGVGQNLSCIHGMFAEDRCAMKILHRC